jgi:hypothetical protein
MHQQLWGYKVEWKGVSRGTGGKKVEYHWSTVFEIVTVDQLTEYFWVIDYNTAKTEALTIKNINFYDFCFRNILWYLPQICHNLSPYS